MSASRPPRKPRQPRGPRPPRPKFIPLKQQGRRGIPTGKKWKDGPEHRLQKAVATFLFLALPDRNPDIYWTGIDHAAAASAAVGRGRKERGIKAGIPDLHFLHRGRSIWIELKAEDGSLSDEQQRTRIRIISAGGHWHEARSVEQVQAILLGHGIALAAAT